MIFSWRFLAWRPCSGFGSRCSPQCLGLLPRPHPPTADAAIAAAASVTTRTKLSATKLATKLTPFKITSFMFISVKISLSSLSPYQTCIYQTVLSQVHFSHTYCTCSCQISFHLTTVYRSNLFQIYPCQLHLFHTHLYQADRYQIYLLSTPHHLTSSRQLACNLCSVVFYDLNTSVYWISSISGLSLLSTGGLHIRITSPIIRRCRCKVFDHNLQGADEKLTWAFNNCPERRLADTFRENLDMYTHICL